MQKWEYKIMLLSQGLLKQGGGLGIMVIMFNEIGTDGWELVGPLEKDNEGNTISIFKKPC